MGEEKSVLRWGGIAGILAGIILLIFGLIASSTVQMVIVTDIEQYLVNFQANPVPLTVFFDFIVVSVLLLLPLFAALYWSLREPGRVFARMGLGLGVLAVILIAVAVEVNLVSTQFFSLRFENAAASDQPTVAAVFAGWHSLVTAGQNIGLVFLGIAFVTFGGAMRASPGYPEGFSWLSAVLGLVIALLVFLNLDLVSIVFLGLLGLVLGWKVYSLSRGPASG